MVRKEPIRVTSHVARDFLQNAAYFNTMPKVVWEYVANSLDAAKDSIPCMIAVDVTSHEIRVSDNGRGMSRKELNDFFQMHGENVQRKRGKKVRGRFGTGKCAAFGLADSLRIDTVQSGIRNIVALQRRDIRAAQSGKPFPVQDVMVQEQTDEEDGTVVEIRDFNTTRADVDKVIAYVERHLSRYARHARVTINGHLCKFEEPLSVDTHRFTAPTDVAEDIGQVELIVKVSPVPLDEDARGIDILSHGIWHETTLAGLDRKEHANCLFGEIDVPLLEDGDWAIPAFDNTRNNTLNRQNRVVLVLLGWVSEELETVRLVLVDKERQRRESDTAKQLAKEAERISDLLNKDFAQQEMELELTRSVSRRSGGRTVSEILDDAGEPWPGGGQQQTQWEQTGAEHGRGKRGTLAGNGDTPRPGPTARPGTELGAPKSTAQGREKRRRAIFSIEYEHTTSERERSRYDGETKTIYINLDHPQIASAFEAGGERTDSRQFRQICYEVAAVEYAIALPYEKLERDEIYHYHAEDALFDVKETIDRVTKRFVDLIR